MARREAEKESCMHVVPSNSLAPTGTSTLVVEFLQPEALLGGGADNALVLTAEAVVQPYGSSSTPILVEETEQALESMPPPPTKERDCFRTVYSQRHSQCYAKGSQEAMCQS